MTASQGDVGRSGGREVANGNDRNPLPRLGSTSPAGRLNLRGGRGEIALKNTVWMQLAET